MGAEQVVPRAGRVVPRAGRVAPRAVWIRLDVASYGARRRRKASEDPPDVRRLSPKSVVPQNAPVIIT